MGDLSKNFSSSEFRCKCGQCDPIEINPELIEHMQNLRDLVGKPITIHSGHRCETYNKRVGGASNSQHLYGNACDFSIGGIKHDDIQGYLMVRFQGRYGIGRYDTFTHFDVRGWEARWDSRS